MSPLAVVMMSGTTFQLSTANHSPVRPQPHITSSAIIWMPNLRAQLPDALQVPVGRDQDAVRAGHRLQDERRDRLRSLELDRLLEQLERRLGVVEPALRAVIGIEHVHDAGHRRDLVRPATGVAGQRHRGVRRAVVAAIAGQHLLPSGHGLRHLDRVLVGLGAAEREERLLDRHPATGRPDACRAPRAPRTRGTATGTAASRPAARSRRSRACRRGRCSPPSAGS